MRFITLACLLIVSVFITPWSVNQVHASTEFNDLLKPKSPQFLKVDAAFKIDFDQQGSTLFVGWEIADGYYLYKEKLEFVANGADITPNTLPTGEDYEDEFFGQTQIYRNELVILSKLNNITDGAYVKVRYQGCAEAGLCYEPVIVEIPLTAYASANTATKKVEAISTTDKPTTNNDDLSLTDKLNQQDLVTNLAIFFVLGLTLAFTPCVFPMFPILSSLIAGQQGLSTKRAFTLSFVYVQGMAITYALLGLLVASLGGQVQGYIQHPAVLISFSILFVVLAMSMFGFYEFKLPESWMTRLTQLSNSQKSGNYFGVFSMGILSGLIASPCTTAPLSAALLYVAQSGDYFVGGITLYVLSLGMGIPLLLLGTSGGKLLPKAGAWMEQVKTLFGFVMLVVPLILLERIIPWHVIMIIGSVLLLATGAYLYHWHTLTSNNKGKTALWLVAFVMVFSALTSISNQIWPTPKGQITTAASPTAPKQFINVANLDELNDQIQIASEQGKLVMLDLYADWCVACKEFEAYTFPDENVQAAFSNYVLLKADLTESNDITISFMEQFEVFGLPTILFFDRTGKELSDNRVTGFKNAEEFSAHLSSLASQY
jgi:thiol:disulfide interchange protein DsbD